MRLRAKTLVYFKGHFVAEGKEFDAPEAVGQRLVASGSAEALSGGKGSAQTEVVDLGRAPAPAANLRPPRKPRAAKE
ncbi:hypothetical protein [Deinococcus kurensis]|uniref:hypothetical protein n=1 Tax=Deinococcus kurensis TaxID=2662757 RepID=UPI0012D3601D|nr:hypothetical protein [Deinococcus kurensis]